MRIGWGLTGSVWKLGWSFKQQPEIKCNLYTQLFPILLRNKQKPIEIVVIATYGLHSNKYLEILNLTLWGRSLVKRCFGLHSDSWGADEIKGLPILIDFHNRNTEFLLLFSIISPCWYHTNIVTLARYETCTGKTSRIENYCHKQITFALSKITHVF